MLVRCDLNVPMKNGKVTDATRIERAAPTISELAAKGAKVIVLSHFGRPDGKRVPEMSLRPLVEPLRALMAATEHVRGGDYSIRVPEGRADDEIANLGRTFNRMTGQLAAREAELSQQMVAAVISVENMMVENMMEETLNSVDSLRAPGR